MNEKANRPRLAFQSLLVPVLPRSQCHWPFILQEQKAKCNPAKVLGPGPSHRNCILSNCLHHPNDAGTTVALVFSRPVLNVEAGFEGSSSALNAGGASKKENVMDWKNWKMNALTTLLTLAALCGAPAGEVKPTDEGKGADFKGKTVEMKDKGEFAILLVFSAGKEVTATTKGDKETDVHLFVYDSNQKEIGKDTSPGPKCEVRFTPAKDGKYKLLVRNSGEVNKVTLEIKVAK